MEDMGFKLEMINALESISKNLNLIRQELQEVKAIKKRKQIATIQGSNTKTWGFD